MNQMFPEGLADLAAADVLADVGSGLDTLLAGLAEIGVRLQNMQTGEWAAEEFLPKLGAVYMHLLRTDIGEMILHKMTNDSRFN